MKPPVSSRSVDAPSIARQSSLSLLILKLLRNHRLRSIVQPHHLQRLLSGPTLCTLAGSIGLQVGTIGMLAIAGVTSIQQTASAQAKITNVTATYVDAIEQSFTTTTASPCEPTGVGTCNKTSSTTFGKGSPTNDLQANSITTAGGTYAFRKMSDRIKINRIDNANVTGNRQIIFFQAETITKATPTTPGDLKILSGAVSTMEDALLSPMLNRGSDNIFANTITGNALNYNNIERVDYIIDNGITPTSDIEAKNIGFVIMDRGSNDSYKIAPILTLSASIPDTFGTPQVFSINTATTVNGSSSSALYAVMRLESTDSVEPKNLHPVDSATQTIGGHFVSLYDLGIRANQSIYGYSLMAPNDGPTVAADVRILNSSKYPTNTSLGATGGVDLIAGGGVFSLNPLPIPTTSPPELILLKRITKINNLTTGKASNGGTIDLTAVVAQPDNPATPRNESNDATNPNWIANYPKGAIDGGVIKSGDRIEYTIYFLSIGGKPVTNANFCDWVPKNTTFVPDSYGIGRGIQLAIGSTLNTFTNVPDGDRGIFYNPGAIPPTTYPDATPFKLNCMSPAGTDGAVVVNLVNNNLSAPENQLSNATAAGTPGNSYGFVRFVSKIK